MKIKKSPLFLAIFLALALFASCAAKPQQTPSPESPSAGNQAGDPVPGDELPSQWDQPGSASDETGDLSHYFGLDDAGLVALKGSGTPSTLEANDNIQVVLARNYSESVFGLPVASTYVYGNDLTVVSIIVSFEEDATFEGIVKVLSDKMGEPTEKIAAGGNFTSRTTWSSGERTYTLIEYPEAPASLLVE